MSVVFYFFVSNLLIIEKSDPCLVFFNHYTPWLHVRVNIDITK